MGIWEVGVVVEGEGVLERREVFFLQGSAAGDATLMSHERAFKSNVFHACLWLSRSEYSFACCACLQGFY